MARKYARDSHGRFSSTGATARGGRIKASGGKKRETQTAKIKSGGARANTIAKGGNGIRGSVARSLAAMKTSRAAAAKPAVKSAAKPAAKSSRSNTFAGKAAPNKAKAAYRAATGKAREAKMLAGGVTSTKGVKQKYRRETIKRAQSAAAKVRAMEQSRGVTKKRKGKR
jgi:hypothetical protein